MDMQRLDMVELENSTCDTNHESERLQDCESIDRKPSTSFSTTSTMMSTRKSSTIQTPEDFRADKLIQKKIRNSNKPFWITFAIAFTTFCLILIHWIVSSA